MKSGYIEIPSGKIYFEESGEGIPIVFLHGFALDNRIWDNQFKYFSRTYRAIRYDLRGFGKSSLPTDQKYSHHEDLLFLVNSLHVTKSIITGLSLGGAIAINYCLLYPNRVSRLILVDSDIGGYKKSNLSKMYESVETGRKLWYSNPLIARALRKRSVAKKLKQIIDDYSGWHWLHKDSYKEDITPKAIERLSDIHVPTLIIVGEKDEKYFIDAASELLSRIPTSKLNVLKGVGHLSSMEAPLRLNRIINHYLCYNE